MFFFFLWGPREEIRSPLKTPAGESRCLGIRVGVFFLFLFFLILSSTPSAVARITSILPEKFKNFRNFGLLPPPLGPHAYVPANLKKSHICKIKVPQKFRAGMQSMESKKLATNLLGANMVPKKCKLGANQKQRR